jgi:hypothetical protein
MKPEEAGIMRQWRPPPAMLQSELTALYTLADEGPTNIYQVQKKTGKTYSLMFNAVKELEKCRLVKLVEKRQTQKGTTANVYDLTLKGVLSILDRELVPANCKKWDYDLVRGIVEKYKVLLPLIFGKWRYFQKVDGEDDALVRLSAAANNQDLFEDEVSFIPATALEQRIYWFFYFIGLFPVEPMLNEWRVVENYKEWSSWWYDDPDIRAFISKELHAYQKRLRMLMYFVEGQTRRIDRPLKIKSK